MRKEEHLILFKIKSKAVSKFLNVGMIATYCLFACNLAFAIAGRGAGAPSARRSVANQGSCMGFDYLHLLGISDNYCHDSGSGILRTGPTFPFAYPSCSPRPQTPFVCPTDPRITDQTLCHVTNHQNDVTKTLYDAISAVNGLYSASPKRFASPIPVASELPYTNSGQQEYASEGDTKINVTEKTPGPAPGSSISHGGRGPLGGSGKKTSGLLDMDANTNAAPSAGPSSDSLGADAAGSYTSGKGEASDSNRRGGRGVAGLSGAGNNTSVSFNDTDNGTKAMGSEDPEDYFTRIGLEENIFKIVHRRYETKTRPWFVSAADIKPALK